MTVSHGGAVSSLEKAGIEAAATQRERETGAQLPVFPPSRDKTTSRLLCVLKSGKYS